MKTKTRNAWKQFLKNLAIIAIPVALQNMLTTTGCMIDTMMIAPLGETTVGAVGLCAQFSSLMFAGYWGFFGGGMLFFSPQIWCSDNTDPVERLRIQQRLSYLYPPSCLGAHVSAGPHAQTLRATPLPTRGNVSLFGCLGYELDLTELLPVEQTEIRAQIEFYKAHRRTLQYGRFTRGKTDGGGIIWQAKTKEETVAGVFHGVQHAAPGYERLRVTGLDEKKQYRLDSRPQLLRVGDFGSLLRHVLPVKLNPNGLAVQTADSYYKMYDGQQTVTASGAAYSAGIMLAPRFAGTGYDADGRMQGDFGSNVYFIREVQS